MAEEQPKTKSALLNELVSIKELLVENDASDAPLDNDIPLLQEVIANEPTDPYQDFLDDDIPTITDTFDDPSVYPEDATEPDTALDLAPDLLAPDLEEALELPLAVAPEIGEPGTEANLIETEFLSAIDADIGSDVEGDIDADIDADIDTEADDEERIAAEAMSELRRAYEAIMPEAVPDAATDSTVPQEQQLELLDAFDEPEVADLDLAVTELEPAVTELEPATLQDELQTQLADTEEDDAWLPSHAELDAQYGATASPEPQDLPVTAAEMSDETIDGTEEESTQETDEEQPNLMAPAIQDEDNEEPALGALALTSDLDIARYTEAAPQPGPLKGDGDNPFLPQHIRDRLQGNRLLAEALEAGFTADPSPQARLDQHADRILEDLINEYMPRIKRQLRARLEPVVRKHLGGLSPEESALEEP